MLRILPASLLLGIWVLPAAADPPAPLRPFEPPAPFLQDLAQAEALAREALEKMLLSVDTLVRSLPRYEMPEMAENGDIIIRRKPPEPPRRRDPNLL